jgi:hypothetical protein
MVYLFAPSGILFANSIYPQVVACLVLQNTMVDMDYGTEWENWTGRSCTITVDPGSRERLIAHTPQELS